MKYRTGTISLDETVVTEQVLYNLNLAKERLKRFYFFNIIGANTTVALAVRLYEDNNGVWERLSQMDITGIPSSQSSGWNQGFFTSSNIEVRLVSTGLGSGSVNIDYKFAFDDYEDVLLSKHNRLLSEIEKLNITVQKLRTRTDRVEFFSREQHEKGVNNAKI